MKITEGLITKILNKFLDKLEKIQDRNWDIINNDPKIRKLAIELANELNKKYPN